MPSRFVSLIILIYWSVAAFCLLTWDVLPEMTSGYPPDLRAITLAVDSAKPIRWSIQVIDDPRFPDVRRIVGEAVTGSYARPDGWFELTSRVELDAGGLLKGTAFLTRSSIRLEVESRYLVEPSGNLHSFVLEVKSQESRRGPGRGQGRDQGKEDGDRLARPGGHSQQENGDRLRAAERDPGCAWPARSASRPPCGSAVGVAGDQSVHRASRSGESRGQAAGPDPLERQPRDHL